MTWTAVPYYDSRNAPTNYRREKYCTPSGICAAVEIYHAKVLVCVYREKTDQLDEVLVDLTLTKNVPGDLFSEAKKMALLVIGSLEPAKKEKELVW